jgi:hypothetical protein
MRLGERYRLESRLGAGGMGEVWRALDESLSRTVAVKTMLPAAAADPEFVRRFAAEATAMARVNHSAVAQIHDFGRSGGITYLVMEYVDGESLAQRLARDGRLAPDATMRLIAEAAEGLQAVHDQGVLHRDVKPANMLLRRDGRVVLSDFGIARHEDASRLTVTGAILGTPSYLSPEQVLGQPADRRSDVYALGLVAYECLAGERPFVGDNPYAVALQRVQQAPKTIGVNVPAPVLAFVERTLAVDPEKRWPSAQAMAEAARQVPLTSAPVPIRVPDAAPVERRTEKKKLLAAVLALMVIGGIAVGIAVRHRSNGKPAANKPTTASVVPEVPAGFTACGDAFCPVEPMCWNGLTVNSGKAFSPGPVPCSASHYWETFLAVGLPDGPPKISDTAPLIERADMAEVCTIPAVTRHSRQPKLMKSWKLEAWPVEIDGVWLLHCLAQPKIAPSTGTGYKP